MHSAAAHVKHTCQEAHSKHALCLHCRGGALIDATQQGNNARYINHSCDPNCQAQSCLVEGRERVGIVAIKAIPTGQEITYDYHAKPSGVPVVRCTTPLSRLSMNSA